MIICQLQVVSVIGFKLFYFFVTFSANISSSPMKRNFSPTLFKLRVPIFTKLYQQIYIGAVKIHLSKGVGCFRRNFDPISNRILRTDTNI